MMIDLVPEVYPLEMGGSCAPRSEYPNAWAAAEAMVGDRWRWSEVRRRWAVPYRAADYDEECFGDGACQHGECGCFQIVHWQRARKLPAEQRQAIWWLP